MKVVEVEADVFKEWIDGVSRLTDHLQLLGFIDSPLQTAIKQIEDEAEAIYEAMWTHSRQASTDQ